MGRFRGALLVIAGAAVVALGFGIYLIERPAAAGGYSPRVFAAWTYYSTHWYDPPVRSCLAHPPPSRKQIARQIHRMLRKAEKSGSAFGYQMVYAPPTYKDVTSIGQGRFLAEVRCMKRRLHDG